MMIFDFLLIVIWIVSFSSLIATIFKVGFSRAIPFSLLLSIFILYFFALFNQLLYAVYLLKAVGFSGIFITIFLMRNRLVDLKKLFFDNSLYLYLASILLCYIFLNNRHLGSVDELSHWGLYTKNIFAFNSIANSNMNILFYSYPPASNLLQYYVLHLVNINNFFESLQRSEGLIRFSNSILLCSLGIIAADKKIFNSFAITFIIRLLIIAAFVITYIPSLQVEHILAMLFSYIVVMVIITSRANNNYTYTFNLISIVLLFSVISLVKVNGILFALIGVMLVLGNYNNFAFPINNSTFNSRQGLLSLILLVVACLLPIIFSQISWKYIINTNYNVTSPDSIYSSYISNLITGKASLVTGKDIIFKYIQSFYGMAVIPVFRSTLYLPNNYSATLIKFWAGSALFLTCLIAFMLTLYVFIYKKYITNRKKLTLNIVYIFLGLIFFEITQLLFYLSEIFSVYESTTLASFSRYQGVYFYALLFISTVLFFYYLPTVKSKGAIGIITIMMVILLFVAGKSIRLITKQLKQDYTNVYKDSNKYVNFISQNKDIFNNGNVCLMAYSFTKGDNFSISYAIQYLSTVKLIFIYHVNYPYALNEIIDKNENEAFLSIINNCSFLITTTAYWVPYYLDLKPDSLYKITNINNITSIRYLKSFH